MNTDKPRVASVYPDAARAVARVDKRADSAIACNPVLARGT